MEELNAHLKAITDLVQELSRKIGLYEAALELIATDTENKAANIAKLALRGK